MTDDKDEGWIESHTGTRHVELQGKYGTFHCKVKPAHPSTSKVIKMKNVPGLQEELGRSYQRWNTNLEIPTAPSNYPLQQTDGKFPISIFPSIMSMTASLNNITEYNKEVGGEVEFYNWLEYLIRQQTMNNFTILSRVTWSVKPLLPTPPLHSYFNTSTKF